MKKSWTVLVLIIALCAGFGGGYLIKERNVIEVPTIVIENAMMDLEEQQAQTDALTSVVQIRYWDVTNPNVKRVQAVDTLGRGTNYYHLAMLEDGNYLRWWPFRVKLRQPTWNGKKFVENVPSYVKPVKYLITADSTWVSDPSQPQGGYWVIGERYGINPEYVAFEANFWAAVGEVETLMRDRMVIRNKRVFTYVPSGANYRWEMLIDGAWVSVPVETNKYTGRPVWVEVSTDVYAHFAKWTAMYTGDKEYFVAYGQIAVQ